MSDDDDKDDDPKKGRLIVLPGGKKVNTNDIGMSNSIVGASGSIPTSEVLDPNETARLLRERENYVKKQELVQAATRRAPASEMLELTVQEITEELAHLKFERRRASQEGKPTAQHTIARIASLRNLAEVILKHKEHSRAERMDFRSPEFKKVIQAWLEMLNEAMSKVGIGDNEVDLVYKQLQADMADWEKRLLDDVGS